MINNYSKEPSKVDVITGYMKPHMNVLRLTHATLNEKTKYYHLLLNSSATCWTSMTPIAYLQITTIDNATISSPPVIANLAHSDILRTALTGLHPTLSSAPITIDQTARLAPIATNLVTPNLNAERKCVMPKHNQMAISLEITETKLSLHPHIVPQVDSRGTTTTNHVVATNATTPNDHDSATQNAESGYKTLYVTIVAKSDTMPTDVPGVIANPTRTPLDFHALTKVETDDQMEATTVVNELYLRTLLMETPTTHMNNSVLLQAITTYLHSMILSMLRSLTLLPPMNQPI